MTDDEYEYYQNLDKAQDLRKEVENLKQKLDRSTADLIRMGAQMQENQTKAAKEITYLSDLLKTVQKERNETADNIVRTLQSRIDNQQTHINNLSLSRDYFISEWKNLKEVLLKKDTQIAEQAKECHFRHARIKYLEGRVKDLETRKSLGDNIQMAVQLEGIARRLRGESF